MKPLKLGIHIILALVYSLIFIRCYHLFLNFYFEYFGFTLFGRPRWFIFISILISVIPILFYGGYKSISSFISVFIFIILYIPIIDTFALGFKGDLYNTIYIELAFAVGMSLLFLADRFEIRFNMAIGKKYVLFPFILGLTLTSSIFLLIVFRGNLKFVSFEEVYTQRFANDEIGSGLLTRYVSAWLANFMVPICLAYGLIQRKVLYFLAGTMACILIYMATAAKSTLLFPLIYLIFYFLFSQNRIRILYSIMVLGLSTTMASLLAFSSFNMLPSLLLMRTVGNGGLLTMHYYMFFSNHPFTYFSHINIVNFITHYYPYGRETLGEVVGKHFWGDMNANANFWASDGVASSGIFGIIIISVVGVLLFNLFNLVTKNYNPLFVILGFIPFINSLANASLLSSLVTGGGFFMILFFLFNRISDDERISKNKIIDVLH